MGKKKKSWKEGAAGDYLGVSTKSKLAKKYGVAPATGGGRALEMKGLSGSDYRSDKDVKRDIAKKMANDYDVRRSLEAAGLAGDKKAAKLSRNGISKYSKVEKAWDHLSKLKKEHVGGGGMFGAKNAASLTDALVNHDRDQLISKLQGQRDSNKNTTGDGDNDTPRSDGPMSTELSEARARVAQHEEDIYNGTYSSNLYDRNYDPTGAQSFLERYKLKLGNMEQRYN